MIGIEVIQQKLLMMRARGVDEVLIHSVALMYQSGCRVSSILGLSPADITPNGRVILRQGKGSNPLIVTPSFEIEWWLSIRLSGFNPFFYLNYMRLYRLFKDYALTIPNAFGFKTAVTASARKSVAEDVFDNSQNIEIAQSALGHKNSKSTEYYIPSKIKAKKTPTKKTVKKGGRNVRTK